MSSWKHIEFLDHFVEVRGITGFLDGRASRCPHVHGSALNFKKSQKIASSSSHQLLLLDPACHTHTFSLGFNKDVPIASGKSIQYKINGIGQYPSSTTHYLQLTTCYSLYGRVRHKPHLLQGTY